MMNGDVFLNSELGKGSEFSVYLEVDLLKQLSTGDGTSDYNDEYNENSKRFKQKMNKWNNKKNSKERPALVKKEKSYETSQSLRGSQSEKPVLMQSSTGTARSSHVVPTLNNMKPEPLKQIESKGTQPETQDDQKVEVTISTTQSARILIAEDNKVNQEVIKRMLMLLKYKNLTLAADGVEALECLLDSEDEDEESDNKNKFKYDLIFMDVQMPKMDGLEATKRSVKRVTRVQLWL